MRELSPQVTEGEKRRMPAQRRKRALSSVYSKKHAVTYRLFKVNHTIYSPYSASESNCLTASTEYARPFSVLDLLSLGLAPYSTYS
jgi:hypothetical protein